MELTSELVSRFIGGQMEIQNSHEHYLYRGQIKAIAIAGGELRVTFAWLAKMRGGRWLNDPEVDYGASLEIMSAHEISGGRVYYSLMYVYEDATLFPPGYPSNLERSQVDGL